MNTLFEIKFFYKNSIKFIYLITNFLFGMKEFKIIFSKKIFI